MAPTLNEGSPSSVKHPLDASANPRNSWVHSYGCALMHRSSSPAWSPPSMGGSASFPVSDDTHLLQYPDAMRILLAPDKFRSSLSALEVCDALASRQNTSRPDAEGTSF